ncbi:MAG: DUF5312 family protein [Treponema sp.]|nr:DUF5312 family protein [Treponema sp.]
MPDVIGKVINFISRDTTPASDKDILLKQLNKEIAQNKYAKFFRVKQREVDASFAQYFFNIYQVVYPLQTFLKNPENEAKIKQITLEAFLDKSIKDMVKKLSPDVIADRRRTAGAELADQLGQELSNLVSNFDSPKIAEADWCYNLVRLLRQFVLFNFCALLKKFDPEMREGDFQTLPKFTEVEANFIAPELATFMSVMPDTEISSNWKMVFEIFKYCNGGVDVIPPVQWNNLLSSLKDINQSKILDLIGKMAVGNPIWEVKRTIPEHKALSAEWLEIRCEEVHAAISGILGSQKNAQVNALSTAVFGAGEITALEFYTVAKERILLDKGLEHFVYAPALGHFLAFIREYIEREIQELCDILLVRGQWTDIVASRAMSESYHEVIGITKEILELDESLDDNGSNGARLRGALLRVDRDRTQRRYINNIISSVNEEALNILNRATPALIVVGKHFKMLMNDINKKPSELIMNWKELASYSKLPMSQRITVMYQKINYFVQLMVLETKPLEE